MSSYNLAALLGGASYNQAALVGGGMSYNEAALRGGSYNTAALDGGAAPERVIKTYNGAALRGGKRFRKGTSEAKAYMAYLRSLRGATTRKSKVKGGKAPSLKPYTVPAKAMREWEALSARMNTAVQTAGKGIIKRRRKKVCGGSLVDDLVTAVEENPEVVDIAKKGVNFWGSWIGENVRNNRSMDEEIAELEANIAAYKKMSPEEQQAFKEQMRERRAAFQGLVKHGQEHAFDPIHQGVEELKQAKAKRMATVAPNPEPSVNEDIEPTGAGCYKGGKFDRGKDLRDGFMGPYGWIAMGVRKSKEKKLQRLRDEWDKICYG